MNSKVKYTAALAGNPNVGKSTVFNGLTGLKQHTGNWAGKTVEGAVGYFNTDGDTVRLVDVPGTYSLTPHSPEEKVAADFITGEDESAPDGIIAVCDACSLERGLAFVFQLINTGKPVLVCVNLIDEARKRGITVDAAELERRLNAPVVLTAARQGEGLDELKNRFAELMRNPWNARDVISDSSDESKRIFSECVSVDGDPCARDTKLDRIFTGRWTAVPISLLLCAVVFFITLRGSAPITDVLTLLFTHTENVVRHLLTLTALPQAAVSFLCDGVLRVTFWVVAVMSPPMAIFFPLFTFLEDLGYFPRVAYNFDRCFACCGSCGKQSLTMLMGLGCNAVGVTGCRIIDSPRERIISILTNSFMPCNGRFPVLAVFASVLANSMGIGSSSVFTTLCISCLLAAGIFATLAVSKLLSVTWLKGSPSAFTIEMPPFRMPKLSDVLVRSFFDRILKILWRAVAVSVPAGAVIWLLGNTSVYGLTLLEYLVRILEPLATPAGMDGVMLTSFVLALPASEITVPLMMMGYTAGGVLAGAGETAVLTQFLTRAGWTPLTAVCAMVFTLFHWPCSTTVITVYKETKKLRYAVASVMIPTAVGYISCVLLNLLFS